MLIKFSSVIGRVVIAGNDYLRSGTTVVFNSGNAKDVVLGPVLFQERL